jgi:hypothetical protein
MNVEYSDDPAVAVLQKQMEQLMGNGQPGIVAELRSDSAKMREMLQGLNYKIFWAAGVIVLAIVTAGSGTVSLKTILELFK